MQPNQAMGAISRGLKSWMVSGLFAWRTQDCNEKKRKTCVPLSARLRKASCAIKFYLLKIWNWDSFIQLYHAQQGNVIQWKWQSRKSLSRERKVRGEKRRGEGRRRVNMQRSRAWVSKACPVPVSGPVPSSSHIHTLKSPKISLYPYEYIPLVHKIVQIDFHYWQPKGHIIPAPYHTTQCLQYRHTHKHHNSWEKGQFSGEKSNIFMLPCENKYSNQSWGRICRGICIGKYPLFSSNSLPVLGRITLVVPGASPILGQYTRVNCSGELWVDHCSLQPQAHQSYGWKAHWPYWAAFPRLPLRRSPVTLETQTFGKTSSLRPKISTEYPNCMPHSQGSAKVLREPTYLSPPHSLRKLFSRTSLAPDLFLPYFLGSPPS